MCWTGVGSTGMGITSFTANIINTTAEVNEHQVTSCRAFSWYQPDVLHGWEHVVYTMSNCPCVFTVHLQRPYECRYAGSHVTCVGHMVCGQRFCFTTPWRCCAALGKYYYGSHAAKEIKATCRIMAGPFGNQETLELYNTLNEIYCITLCKLNDLSY